MKIRGFNLSIIITLVLILLFPLQQYARADEYAYQEDFEDGQARDWSLDPGWEVLTDQDNHVLAGVGHAWARSNQAFAGDYDLEFRLKLLQGVIHLVYRLNDVGRYFIGFHEAGSYLSKQYWPDVFQDDLIQKKVQHSVNTWHQIKIMGAGNTLKLYVDGEQEWIYTDQEPLQSGSFAFETLDDSSFYIDDIKVLTPASPTPTYADEVSLTPTWTRLGGPLGGLGYDIRMRPENPDAMFVTDAWSGVFASDDGGKNWFPSSDGITTRTGPSGDAIPVFSLTIDPNNSDIIWVGTQFKRGISKSTDGGKTWQRMDNGIVETEGISFRGFTVDPNNSDVVYAAAEISSWAWFGDNKEHMGREFDLTGGVIYKTINGGQSWNVIWRGDNLARYIWINPTDTNIIYISTGIFDREAANSDPVAGIPGGEGVLKSTDGGITWAHVNNGLENLYVGSLFMHPENPDLLLAGTGNNQYNSGAGVYRTQDGGDSWIRTLSIEEQITSVEISTSDPDIAYAAGRFSVFRSEDGGLSWQKVSGGDTPWGAPGVQTGFPIDFQVDPRDPNRIFTNAYGGGAFLSEDGGRSWRDASKGYTGAQVRDIAVDPTAPGRLIVAARSGVFASFDGGDNWLGINPAKIDSLEWNVVAIDPSNPQHLLGGLNVHGLLVDSMDGGKSWDVAKDPQVNQIGWRAIAFAPSDNDIAYAGSAGFYSAGTFGPTRVGIGIFVTHDGGVHWSSANDSLSQDAHVCALAIDPTDPQVVYVATTNHGLMKTSDGGTSWAVVQNGLPASSIILSVTINPLDAKIIFAGLDRGAIYRSTDGGQSWNPSAAGLNPEASITDILFGPNDPEILYLSDLSSGVYQSLDGGQTWQAINTGLLSRSVNALALSTDGLHLYAATEGSGVYRLDLNGEPPQPAQVISTSEPVIISSPDLPASTAPVALPVSTPTATPSAKPGICGSLVLLPLTLAGIVWWRASRNRIVK